MSIKRGRGCCFSSVTVAVITGPVEASDVGVVVALVVVAVVVVVVVVLVVVVVVVVLVVAVVVVVVVVVVVLTVVVVGLPLSFLECSNGGLLMAG